MKRMIIVMLSAVLAVIGIRAETEKVGDYTWTYRINGDTAEICSSGDYPAYIPAVSPSPIGALSIPATLGGKSVVNIGDGAFNCCSNITGVTIPQGVTNIGSCAFSFCHGLSQVTLPDGVVSIGSRAFFYNAIDRITIPATVVSIGAEAFELCLSLSKIDWEGNKNSVSIGADAFHGTPNDPNNYRYLTGIDGVTYIGGYHAGGIYLCGYNVGGPIGAYCGIEPSPTGDYIVASHYKFTTKDETYFIPLKVIGSSAFKWCSDMTSITIPDTVVEIGSVAFSDCRSMTNIVIPANVRAIGSSAFEYCSALETVGIPQCICTNKLSSVFTASYSKIKTVIIQPGVTRIGASLFNGCTAIQNVSIPSSVSEINGAPFSGLPNLLTDTSSIEGVALIDGWAVSRKDSLEGKLNLTGVRGILDNVFTKCSTITSVVIGDEMLSIGTNAFSYCDGLTEAEIGARTVGIYAFGNCSNLANVVLQEGVVCVGAFAFLGCSELVKMELPSSLTNVAASAFNDCENLLELSVDEDNPVYKSVSGLLLSKDGTTLFRCPGGLTNVQVPTGVTSIGRDAFANCRKLVSVTLPSTITNIEQGAFCNCTSLQSMRIPDGVTYIGPQAFSGCTGVVSVTIPAGVTRIGDEMFSGCTNLTSVTIPAGVEYIGRRAFCNCSGLTNVTLPSSLTRIGDAAFSGCRGLTSMTIPNGVTGLPYELCYGCTSITNISIPASVTSIGGRSFAYCSSLTHVDIPDSVGTLINALWASDAPFQGCSNLRSATIPQSVCRWTLSRIFASSCSLLTNVVLSTNVTNISPSAFSGCSGLTSVTIPDSVTSIGDYAFSGCTALTGVYISDLAAWCRVRFYDTPLSYAHNLYLNDSLITELVIPDGVSSINASAFRGCSGLMSVTIPDSVTRIGSYAFSDCSGLTSVTIPDSVTKIWDYAFSGCSGLTSVTIPDSATSIGDSAFSGCSGLTSLTIPDSVTAIGSSVFYKCTGLTNVTISAGVTNISASAFSGCSGLTSVTIPDSVTSIGSSAFSGCTALTGVYISDLAAWCRIRFYGNPLSYAHNLYLNDSLVTDLVIPDGVTSISDFAFCYCNCLSTVMIPDSVTNIEAYAFYECSGLTSVTIAAGVTSIGEGTFSGCSGLTSVTIPGSVTSIGNYAFSGCIALTGVYISDLATWCRIRFNDNPLSYAHNFYLNDSLITDLVIPDGVSSISASAFRGCSGLTSVTIPDSVTSIENDAFSDCSGLTSVTISAGLSSISAYAFRGCSGLTSVTIPDSVTSIGAGTFSGCSGLTSVTIPDSVTSIGDYAFSGCTALTGVYISDLATWCRIRFNDNPLSYAHNLYLNDSLITDLVIPDGVLSISASAFRGCSGLSSVTIPDSVTSIEDYAFSDCSGLTSVTISAGLSSISASAFRGCSGLTSMTIPDSVTSIGNYAFSGCSGLTSMTISDSVTSIGNDAFTGCSGLTSVTIPDGVTSIGSYAFRYCSGLTELTFGKNVKSVANGVLWNCDSLKNVSVTGDVFSGYENIPWSSLDRIYDSIVYAKNWWPIFEKYGIEEVVPLELMDYSIKEETVGGKTWKYYENGGGGVICSGGWGAAVSPVAEVEALVVPDTLGGLPVTEVGFAAFEGLAGLVKIDIPETVTNIANYAFYECNAMTEAKIPAAVQTIGDYAFTYCNMLTKVTFGASSALTSIGDAAFRGCYNMSDFILPVTVTNIGKDALQFAMPRMLSGSVSGTLKPEAVYVVSNSVDVARGAKLTIPAGTILKFNTGASLTVYGILDAQGTRAKPVIFTSLKDDDYGGDTNGDGDNTSPQPGAWTELRNGGGTLHLSFAKVLYGGYGYYVNQADAAVRTTSGTTVLNCCEIKHADKRLIGQSGGTVMAENCILQDGRWGIDGSVTFVNGIIADCTTGTSGGVIKNTIYYNCGTYSSGSSVSNSIAYGTTQSVQNGLKYADPMFLDPENSDFRIAANSPCVDAGDGTVAPELDYYGQPRMEVMAMEDAGTITSEGVCPDIGIYEVPGYTSRPLPDLAVLSVGVSDDAPTAFAPGDTVEITYTVTNRGNYEVSGEVRDSVTFHGDVALGGQIIGGETLAQKYSLAAGASSEMRTKVKLPSLGEGRWLVAVTVNSERDVYEANTVNNTAESGEMLTIAIPSLASGGTRTVTVPAGGSAGVAVTGLWGGAVVATLPQGAAFYASVGYMPDVARHDVAGRRLADGRMALVLPPHEDGETVYVTIENESGFSVQVTLSAQDSADGLKWPVPDDVEVTKRGPNVEANLVLPTGVRDGRMYAAWVEYANTGDEDAELPIFTVERVEGGATFAKTARGAYSANALPLIGLAPSAPRGKLKPGEKGSTPFYILSSGALSVKLGIVSEISTNRLNGFETIAAYRAGMSAAATRLCARGGDDPDFSAVLAQALNEKRGAAGAAVYGALKHALTHLPLAGVEMHLVATNGDEAVSAAVTDANGHFTLTADEAGDYVIELSGVASYEPKLCSLAVGEDVPVSLSAIPYSTLSGCVTRPDFQSVAAGATVVLDDLSTEKDEDYIVAADAAGRYSFSGLNDGEYRLSAYPMDGYVLVESAPFVVTNGTAYTRHLSYGEKGRIVAGRVTDVETGAAVTNAVVLLSRDGMQLGVMTDTGGRFSFDGLAPGEWKLSLQSSDYQVDGMNVVTVTAGEGEQTLDIKARMKGIFAVLRPVGLAPHKAKFALIRDDVTNLSWDFNGDGVADSTTAAPEWTFANAGNYTVTLSYTDPNGVRRKSKWTDAVRVVERFENVLKPNGVLITAAGGVEVVSVSTNELVLSGSAVAGWTEPGTVIGAETSAKGGFIRRVLSAQNTGGNTWRFTVEEAGLEDLYEQYFMTSDIAISAQKLQSAMAKAARALMKKETESPPEVMHGSEIRMPSRGADRTMPFTLGYDFNDHVSVSMDASISSWTDAIAGSYGEMVFDGKKTAWYSTKDTYSGRITVSGTITTTEDSVAFKKKEYFKKEWNKKLLEYVGPYGITLGLQVDASLELNEKGSGTISQEVTFKAQRTQILFLDDEDKIEPLTTDWGVAIGNKRTVSGSLSVSLEGEIVLGVYGSWAKIFGRAGGGVKVGAEVGISQNLSLSEAYTVGMGALDSGVEMGIDSKLELFLTLSAGLKVSWKWLNIEKFKSYSRDLPCLKAEWQNTASVGDMGIEISGDGLTVTAKAQNPKIEAEGYIFKDMLGLDGIEVPAEKFLWKFGDGSLFQEGREVSHTYAKPGQYTIRLFGESPIPATLLSATSPFVRTATREIEVFTNGTPYPPAYTNSYGLYDHYYVPPRRSWDPNEMDGPNGEGENRLVKPGDWMTYTVYFENKTDADVPAQEVYVANPLSAYLDWSTFEMLDFAFCNQVETGLSGRQNGSVTVDQDGTAYKAKVEVALDKDKGVVNWYLRSWDPARADYNYWPPDGEGLLPPNDATHRGEGHLTYRIKVRDDAPANVVVTNSATIVFDTNDPIETDPAWWNTVAGVAHVTIGGGEVDGSTNLVFIVGQPYGNLPTPRPREGYEFGGWYTGPNGTGRLVTAESIVQAGDSGLYAYWTAIPVPDPEPDPVVTQQVWTVTFDAQGGVVAEASRVVTNGCAVGELPVAAWDGYAFGGWFTAVEGGTQVTADTIVTDAMTLYAHKINYSYTYFDNGDGTVTLTYETEECGDYCWRNHSISPTPVGAFSLPDMIDGKRVVAIEWGFFGDCYEMTSVTIPASVTNLSTRGYPGAYMFMDLYRLTNIVVAADNPVYKSVDGILYTKDGKSLIVCPEGKDGDVVVAPGTECICSEAFRGCDASSVSLPATLTKIERTAFQYCCDLTSITIPANVECIGDRAFEGCSSLATVSYEGDESQMDIAATAFVGTPYNASRPFSFVIDECGTLTCIHGTPPETLVMSDYTGGQTLTAIGNDVFEFCDSLASVTIPDGVTSIGGGAFCDCSSLTNMTIPDSVTVIGHGAFSHCGDSLYDTTTMPGVRLVDGWAVGKEDSFSGELDLNGVRGIANCAFIEDILLTGVTIPGSMKIVAPCAFSGCSALTGVTLSEGVAEIGEQAFYGCSSLVNVVIPRSVTNIEDAAFYKCSGLTNVTFEGDAPAQMGNNVFGYVSSSCTVYVRGNSTGWGVDIPGTWHGVKIAYIAGTEPILDPLPDPEPGPDPDPIPEPDPVVTQQVWTITIPRAGWNLVSFSVLPDDPSPDAVFAEVADSVQSVISGTRRWTPQSGGRLAALQIGVGYWVKTTRDNVEWTISGKPDEDIAINVNAGWNLIGYPLLEAGAPEAVLKSASDAGIVSSVISGTRRWTPQSGGRLTEMTPGVGYWLKAAKPGTIKFDR